MDKNSQPENFFSNKIISGYPGGLITKTIILRSPEDCLNYENIVKKLLSDGCQILPSAIYPNEIRISYIENIRELTPDNIPITDNNELDNSHIFVSKLGSPHIWS